MRPWALEKLQENVGLIEKMGPIASVEVDGSYLSWLRYFHSRMPTPGMKEAMVMATNAVLTNRPLFNEEPQVVEYLRSKPV